MSAIFGLFYPDGRPVERSLLESMSHTLAHRGRDGSGLWSDGNVGLGHRMCWVTPESLTEQLPSAREDLAIAVTADARIDNRDELIDVLGLGGVPAREVSDSAIVAAAYDRWGEDCPGRLIGDFVLAVWDRRRRSLFCARDPFGTKHVCYYHRADRVFAFASEIKALFCSDDVPREINEMNVADHLVPTLDDKCGTSYVDVWRLPAAHCLRVDARGLKVWRYYEPDLEAELRLDSDDEYAEAFREHFVEAVRCRTRSAYPVGATLSGGLDSSSIACCAVATLENEGRLPLHTFSAVWPSLVDIDPKVDEGKYIRAVTAGKGYTPHYIRADNYTPLTFLDQINWHLDGVLAAPNVYATWAKLEAASKQNVRVLFHGTDGDSTVSYGYEDLFEFARRGWWRSLVRESFALSRNMPSRAHRPKKLIWRMGIKPLLPFVIPEPAKEAWSVIRRQPRMRGREVRVLRQCEMRPFNPDFARRTHISERFLGLRDAADPPMSTTREQHWSAISCGMFSYLLETFEKIGGPFSVEFRYPFFDRRLVEFCLSLPPGQRLQNGWTRSVLRRAMAGILPPEIQWRAGKGNLSANVRLILNREEHALDEVFLENSGVLEPYIDIPRLREMYKNFKAEPILDHDSSYFLLLAVTLYKWLQAQTGAAVRIG